MYRLNETWYHLNDEEVDIITNMDQFLSHKIPYLVMYERIKEDGNNLV